MHRLLTLLVGVALVATPALSFEGWFTATTPTGDTQTPIVIATVGQRARLLFDVDETAGQLTTTITAEIPFQLCFCPNNAAACAATTARVKMWYWPNGVIVDATGDNIPDSTVGAIDVGAADANTSFDGTPGPAGTQNSCWNYNPGLYAAEIDVDCAQGAGVETCELIVTGIQ